MTNSERGSILFLTSALLLGVSATGCSTLGSGCDTSNDSNEPIPYEQGQVVGNEYMSSPWTGALLPFPSGKRYDLKHHLGCIPRDIGCWVSFSSTGTGESSLAPASGNMCLLQQVNDSFVQIKNDTCSDMFVLVTASCKSESSQSPGSASPQDAGTDAP